MIYTKVKKNIIESLVEAKKTSKKAFFLVNWHLLPGTTFHPQFFLNFFKLDSILNNSQDLLFSFFASFYYKKCKNRKITLKILCFYFLILINEKNYILIFLKDKPGPKFNVEFKNSINVCSLWLFRYEQLLKY